jgi:hypothetical protein
MSTVALAALGVFALVGPASGAPSTNGSNAQSNSVKSITHDCTADRGSGGGMQTDDLNSDHDTITFQGPTVLWPPNHKYRTVTITSHDVDGLVDPGDAVTANTTAASSDPDLTPGSGHTLNDATPATQTNNGTETVVQTVQLRGERSGRIKAGRTYTLMVTAMFDNPGSANMDQCHATFTVTVPHDMGNH